MVSHLESGPTGSFAADGNLHVRARWGVIDSITNEIGDNLAKPRLVPLDGGWRDVT